LLHEMKVRNSAMFHSEIYQRMFVLDPDKTLTVTTFEEKEKTYTMVKTDKDSNYLTASDYSKMPPGTDMVDVARNVHMPNRATCLRCHAAAGGGDWTKRGGMGWSSETPPVTEDVHLSPDGADLQCVNCHVGENHKIGGRGIDLRQTEATKPTCQDCHSSTPHSRSDLNRHAQGQVGCQVCHIHTYGKGGATEISRDWQEPHYNPALCFGQGGFVGLEEKKSFVAPEYVWFNGKSTVYNIGETIFPDDKGVYHMASAVGKPFDGVSKIVSIKRHWSFMPVTSDNQIVPPVIMWMFMTGIFDTAVQEGLAEWKMGSTYDIVSADAEMLITHGVEPSEEAPSCSKCHEAEEWEDDSHKEHIEEGVACNSCHTFE